MNVEMCYALSCCHLILKKKTQKKQDLSIVLRLKKGLQIEVSRFVNANSQDETPNAQTCGSAADTDIK